MRQTEILQTLLNKLHFHLKSNMTPCCLESLQLGDYPHTRHAVTKDYNYKVD